MHAVPMRDPTGYPEHPAAAPEGAESRIRRMFLEADMGDRKAAIGIVSRMISARRFGPAHAVADVGGLMQCLDELELLFALELSSIEDEIAPVPAGLDVDALGAEEGLRR